MGSGPALVSPRCRGAFEAIRIWRPGPDPVALCAPLGSREPAPMALAYPASCGREATTLSRLTGPIARSGNCMARLIRTMLRMRPELSSVARQGRLQIGHQLGRDDPAHQGDAGHPVKSQPGALYASEEGRGIKPRA